MPIRSLRVSNLFARYQPPGVYFVEEATAVGHGRDQEPDFALSEEGAEHFQLQTRDPAPSRRPRPSGG